MTNVIRLDANLKAPDFTKTKPRLHAEEYQVDCCRFASWDDLEQGVRNQFFEKGLVILTNTTLKKISDIKKWGAIVIENFEDYQGGAFSRKKLSDVVYDTGTEPINLYSHPHNEMAYLPRFPRCVLLGCTAMPKKGGETLVSDNIAVTREILKTELGQKLKEKGVTYIRNMTDATAENPVIYKHWQDAFSIESRRDMESIAKNQGWTIKWRANGECSISVHADAYEYNEALGENLLFAPVGAHGMHFDDWSPFNTLPFEERPGHMTYGDGDAFTDQEMKRARLVSSSVI